MKRELEARIIELVEGHKGIKASWLCSQLTGEYIDKSALEIKMTIITMIANKRIYEIEYTLPNKRENESLLLPVGSEFKGVN